MSAEFIHIKYPDGNTWKELYIEPKDQLCEPPIQIAYPGKFSEQSMLIERRQHKPRSPYHPGYKLLDARYSRISAVPEATKLHNAAEHRAHKSVGDNPDNTGDHVTRRLSRAIARSGVAVEGIIAREIEDNDWGIYEESCEKQEKKAARKIVFGGVIAVSILGAVLHHGAIRTYASEELRQIQAESGFVPYERSTFCDKIEQDNIANYFMRPILKPVAEYFDQCKPKEVQVAKVVFESK